MSLSFLDETAHRPWPLPSRRWVQVQEWHDLLFAHWPLEPAKLVDLLPKELELDTRDGQAWVGVVPFRMVGVRLRGMPALPRLSAFPELNVRTYVRHEGRPGVWFFSLDAASTLAVRVARAWYGLPYFHARMMCEERRGTWFYASERDGGGKPASFRGWYRPTAPAEPAAPGSLEHFLVERYCLFTRGSHGRIQSADIHHRPWQLAPARAELAENTMAAAAGIELPTTAPLLHFSPSLRVVAWAPREVGAKSDR